MGEEVFNTTTTDATGKLRAYAHCVNSQRYVLMSSQIYIICKISLIFSTSEFTQIMLLLLKVPNSKIPTISDLGGNSGRDTIVGADLG